MPSESINYDRAADFYDETRGFPDGMADEIATLIAQKALLKSDTQVLEIGIGTGRMALPLSDHVGSITGVDISRKMMAKLRQKQTTQPVVVAEADAHHVPFAAQVFDRVFISHVLHLVPEPARVLEETARVLKRPGQLLYVRSTHDRHDKIKPLFDTWNQFRKVIPEGPHDWRSGDSLMGSERWYKLEDYRFTYPGTVNPARVLETIEKRRWSNIWYMSDGDIFRAYEAVKATAIEQFGEDYDVDLETTSGIMLQVFVPLA